MSGMIDLALVAVYFLRVRRAGGSHARAGASLTVFAVVLVAGVGLSGTLAGTARADTTEPSILMDDYAFIYSSPAQVEKNLRQVASLGVNTIKVSMVWSLVAPDPTATTEPAGRIGNIASSSSRTATVSFGWGSHSR